MLTIGVFTIALVNLGLAYRMNVWHRVMFDALESRDAAAVFRQSLILFPLVVATVAMGCANTFSRMTLQREWRSWLNSHVLDRWLRNGRYLTGAIPFQVPATIVVRSRGLQQGDEHLELNTALVATQDFLVF